MEFARAWGGSWRCLYATWLLWLASFIVPFGWPVWHLGTVPPGWEQAILVGFPWQWTACTWVPPVLALLVPALLHRRQRGRLGDPYFRAIDPDAPAHSYRSAPRSSLVLDQALAHRLVASYAARLALAIALMFLTFEHILFSNFVYTCTSIEVRPVDEHLAITTLCFAVALSHVPTRRHVFGLPRDRRLAPG